MIKYIYVYKNTVTFFKLNILYINAEKNDLPPIYYLFIK